jgi:serine/threonine protein kinase
MNRIEPIINYQPPYYLREFGSIVVFMALATLSSLVYYLMRQYLSLSPRAQIIRENFRHAPDSFNELDMVSIAKKVESLEKEIGLEQDRNPTSRYQVKSYSGLFQFQFKARKFLITEEVDNTWRVQYIETLLGRGGFGKVIGLFDLHTGVRTALKIATPPKELKENQTYIEQANKDLEKEYRNLIRVHTSPDIEPIGVQDKPLSVIVKIIKLYQALVRERMAYEGTCYDGSLDKLLRRGMLPLKMRLGIALQVLQGMNTLIRNKLISHDLKTPNILYRERAILPECHVSDLGGVTHEDELQSEINSGGLVHTPAFADTKRIQLAESVSIGFVQRSLVRTSEKGSIGLIILTILTGQDVTVNSNLEEIWRSAKIPLESDYKKLFSVLKTNSSTRLCDAWFKSSVSNLIKMVQKLHQQN